MLISLTVGKVDAGVAVLLTPDKRLVSILPVSLDSPAGLDLSTRYLLSAIGGARRLIVHIDRVSLHTLAAPYLVRFDR